jgi:import inner membrane translocase subunit TIM16
MTLDEAAQILNIPKNNIKKSEILERYETMFKQNDPAQGGSLYLQSKILRAKERLETEFEKK